MTRFIIGLLLGLLLGIGGTAAFLITAGGGDYLIVSSPRVRELEASLKNVDQDRQWLRSRLNESSETIAKLESRFSALAARFETMTSSATQATPSGASASASADGASGATPSPMPTATVRDDDASGAPDADPTPLDPATAPVEEDSKKDGPGIAS